MLIVTSHFFEEVSMKIFANTISEDKTYEEMYPEIGYKTIEEAIKEFEQHFDQDFKLPLRLPPISFTHHFGKFNDSEGEMNDFLELEYIHDSSPENHYYIFVKPIEHKLKIKDKRIINRYHLKNGNEAVFLTISESIVGLAFERDGWQYMLSIPKALSKKVTPERLVEIANSIDYPSEKENPLE